MGATPPTSGASFFSRFNPTNGIRRAGREVGQFLGGGVGTISHTPKLVTAPLKPLAPALLAGSMLLYQRGEEQKKQALSGNGDPGKPLLLLANMVAGSFLALTTAGVYTIAALAKTMIDAGRAEDAMDKLKATVQNVGIFTTAYMGFWLGSAVKDGLERASEINLKQQLENSHPWISSTAATGTTTAGNSPEALANELQELKKQLDQLHNDVLNNATIDETEKIVQAKALRAGQEEVRASTGVPGRPKVIGIYERRTRAWELLNKLRLDPTHKGLFSAGSVLDKLTQTMSHTEHWATKFSRSAVSPVIYGLLTASVIGVFFVRSINSMIEKYLPHLRGKEVNWLRTPELPSFNSPADHSNPNDPENDTLPSYHRDTARAGYVV